MNNTFCNGIIGTNLINVPALLSTAGNVAHICKGDASMKSIPLTRGKFALVDDGDFEYLNQFKWCFNGQYAARRGAIRGKSLIRMHRVVMCAPAGYEVDHINGDKLDNRRANLRLCTRAENQRHKARNRQNTTGYKGVRIDKRDGYFSARIRFDNKELHLGRFRNAVDAARAYDAAAKKLHGDFAWLNFPEGEK
jgi:hypothetical protein